MSFEYTFVASATLNSETLIKVFTCFEKQVAPYANNLDFDAKASSRNYHFISALRKEWPEDFTISLTVDECYLGFHSATGEQRAEILSIITKCLYNFDVVGYFEEQ
jgi:hypothetical protein